MLEWTKGIWGVSTLKWLYWPINVVFKISITTKIAVLPNKRLFMLGRGLSRGTYDIMIHYCDTCNPFSTVTTQSLHTMFLDRIL